MTLWVATVVCGIIGATLQIAAHLFFWVPERRLKRTEAYTVGTTIVGAVWTVWCIWTKNEAALAWWVIAGMSGGVVLTAWWVRGWLERRDARLRQESYQAGQAQAVVAAATEDGDATNAAQPRD